VKNHILSGKAGSPKFIAINLLSFLISFGQPRRCAIIKNGKTKAASPLMRPPFLKNFEEREEKT